MTEPDAMTTAGLSGASGPDAADPRHLVLADLAARLASGLTTRAQAYEAAARQAEGDLREALERLARAKRAQAADLFPVARGPAEGSRASASPPAAARPWGVVLGEAFQDERDLERTGRELAVLAEAPALKALAARLAGGAARDGEVVRGLYLRYS